MASKCNACGKFLASIDGATCTKCAAIFHRSCVKLSSVGRVPAKWLCCTCRTCKESPSTQSTNNNFSSPLDKAEELPENAEDSTTLAKEMRLLRTEFIREMAQFRQEVSRLNSVISEFNKRFETVEERLTSLEASNKERQAVMNKSNDVSEVVNKLRSELNEREQENLLNDVEITGLDERSGENATHLVVLLAKKLGADLEEHDIVSAERSGPRRIIADRAAAAQPRSRPLVVRLARRAVRDALLSKARVRRNTDSSGVTSSEPRRVYVNERLTSLNRQLFYKTREECRRVGWKFAWTKAGRIYVRMSESTEIRRIRSQSDIDKFFGNITI